MTEKEHLAVSALNAEYELLYQKKPGTFVEMLCPKALAVDFAEQSLRLSFHALPWMRNPIGTVHGGVVAAMADIAMTGIGRVFKEKYRVGATIHMNIEYLRPVLPDKYIIVKAICTKAGRSAMFMTCHAYEEGNPDKILFTASGCFANKLRRQDAAEG